MPKLINSIFAKNGDVAYPADSSTDGTVNLDQGYTPQYEIDLASGDPTAKAVERNITNGLFNWLFDNQSFEQAHGVAPWFSNMTGGYPVNALVADNSTGTWQIYRSLIDNNSSITTLTSAWEMLITQTEMLNRIPFALGGAKGSSSGALTKDSNISSWAYSQGLWVVSTDAIASGVTGLPSKRQGVLIARNTNTTYNPTTTSQGISFFQTYIDADGYEYKRFYGVPAGGSVAAWTSWRTVAFLDSPAFTGAPTAPTAPTGTKTTQIASTEFVNNSILAAPGRLRGKPITFTSNGTYTPSDANVKFIIVEAVGGGAGGGGAGATGSDSFSAGGSGTGGAYCLSLLSIVDDAITSVAVTVGTAGAGGNGAPSNGSPGTASKFGSFITAAGGNGAIVVSPQGGAFTITGTYGGAASGGNLINRTGDSSGSVICVSSLVIIPAGGSSPLGMGGSGYASFNNPGKNATGYGAGGSGASSNKSPNAYYSGGNGSPGLVRVWEFY